MKRNAFTLVELLAVIVILAIVLIIAVPGVLSIINQTKQNAYDRQIDMIKEAARTYVTTNDQVQWKDNRVVVNLADLQGLGLLEKKLIDPRDQSEIKGIAVLVTKNGTKITYEIVYTDSQNSNYPVFSKAMIPIVYKDGNWVKADATNQDQKWFDYSKQQWANIATVTEDVRQSLLDAPIGTIVPMDKINTMFTWIPRFKYKLWNTDGTLAPTNNANLLSDYTIQIEMEGKDTPKSKGTQNGQWLTHPAFTYGTTEISGFWMAKFETGYAGATTTTDAQKNEQDPTKVIVKPNVPAWRSIDFRNIYYNSKGIVDQPLFGFTDKEDPHLTKSMEWAAVAYLSSSNYGKTGNPDYASDKEVRINNNQLFLTGCGASVKNEGPSDVCNPYDTAYGQAASTTGNITGIYGMNGGAWDAVAGLFKNETTDTLLEKWGFTKEEREFLKNDEKHFDIYVSNNHEFVPKLGDATIEMGPFSEKGENNLLLTSWYQDNIKFQSDNNIIVLRGRSVTSRESAGVFESGPFSGDPLTYIGYRISVI